MVNEAFTDNQRGAIRKGMLLASRLQRDVPEISDLYRRGDTSMQIAQHLDISSNYGVSEGVARVAVLAAIRGYKGAFGVDSLEGLITDEDELEELERSHQKQAATEMYGLGLGIHAETNEGRSKRARKAYQRGRGLGGMSEKDRTASRSKAGRAAYEGKRGVHGMTSEQLSSLGSKGAINSMRARGVIPWVGREKERAYELSQSPEYQRGTLTLNGRIAITLNAEFHNHEDVRKSNSVRLMLRDYHPKG